MEKPDRVFIVGFMGSDRMGLGKSIADEYSYELISLDKKIEEEEGRSIKRICMVMGEHEYRNREFEMLEKLCDKSGIVVVCGDGIIFDDDNLNILRREKTIAAGTNMTIDELWENAKNNKSIPYAFMTETDEHMKYEKFYSLYLARRHKYREFV